MSDMHAASREWATRPTDERFASMANLHNDAVADKAAAREVEVDGGGLTVEARDGAVWLRSGAAGAPLGTWAFEQAARLGGAPPSYLQGLTATTAASALNESLKTTRAARMDSTLRLLTRKGEIAAINGPRYGRIWDADVISEVKNLGGNWTTPPAYGEAPSGLYRGDRDMFIFQVDGDRRIEDGSPQGLGRGFFVWNSEVGARSFGISTFFYRYICGNHIVWGASNVTESRLRHVGAEAWTRARAEVELNLRQWANEGASGVEAQIRVAQATVLGKDKAATTAAVVRATGASAKLVSGAWDAASQWVEADGAPNTLWGMAQAITRYSQSSPWTAARVETDRVAGQLLSVVIARS